MSQHGSRPTPACPDPTGRDETAAEFFARISNPATPALDKLERWAADVKRAELQVKLDEATKHRDHYNQLARETRDMAAERETSQGREATMAAAMRYKAQALVWEREVSALTAQLVAPVEQAAVELPADAVAGMDSMAGVL
jgi:hypothetical protein